MDPRHFCRKYCSVFIYPGKMFIKIMPRKSHEASLVINCPLHARFHVESEGWGFEYPSGGDIFCFKRFDTFTRTPVRVSFFSPRDLEIWWMTPKNRAPLLCYFKLCASFRSHWWIQTGVRVRKRPIWVKFDNFLSRVTLKFDGWHWKPIGHLS